MDSRIKTIHNNLISGKSSCCEMIQEKLSLLKAKTDHSANLLLEEWALAQAKKVDQKIQSGKPVHLLEGVPFGIADMILLQNTITTGNSTFLRNYIAPYTATTIQHLLDAGAIPIVKENGDCFGHGHTSENTLSGTEKNAHDEKNAVRVSSSGSAIDVSKGYTAFSIGSDTGGSLRQSAGYNTIYGLKPTYGKVSRFGLIANASSMDVIGPFASSLEDIRILINAMSGKDPKDLTSFSSSSIPETVFEPGYLQKEMVVGYYPNFLEHVHLDGAIKNDFQKMLDVLSAKGLTLKPLQLFDVQVLVSVFYVLAMAETASNLARLDGCLYGARSKNSSNKDLYMKTRAEYFTEETKRRIIGGTLVLSHGTYEEIYLKAKTLRSTIIGHFKSALKEVDIILSPVSPVLPSDISSSFDDPHSMYLSDAFTAGFSLGGLPTLTVPYFLPTGIQITANKNQEDRILSFAHVLKEMLE